MIKKVILIVICVILVIFLGFLSYVLYMNLFSEPEEFEIDYIQREESYGKDLQFYPNMRFNHKSISYSMIGECSQKKKSDMQDAFSVIESKTDHISFYESSNPDIEIN